MFLKLFRLCNLFVIISVVFLFWFLFSVWLFCALKLLVLN